MKKNISAQKRQRQNEKKRLANKHYKTLYKNTVKRLMDVAKSKKKKEAEKLLNETVSVINKVRIKGIIHKNTASRKISQLTKLVSTL